MVSILNPRLYLDDLYCKNCQNEDNMRYDHHEGTILCISCGNVAQNRFIDFKEEYRVFSAENGGCDAIRVGGEYNENFEDGGMGAYIEESGNFKKMWTQGYNSKYYEGTKKLKNWGFALGLDKGIVNYAIDSFEKFSKKKSFHKNSDELLAAILYLSARSENSFLDLNELENVCGKPKKNIKKCFWLIKKSVSGPQALKKSLMKPSYYTKLFGLKLNLPQYLVEKMKKIGEKFEEVGILEGKDPKNIASVIIYNESKLEDQTKKTFKEIAVISGISDQTIKSTYESLIKKLSEMDFQISEKKSLEDVLKELEKLHV